MIFAVLFLFADVAKAGLSGAANYEITTTSLLVVMALFWVSSFFALFMIADFSELRLRKLTGKSVT